MREGPIYVTQDGSVSGLVTDEWRPATPEEAAKIKADGGWRVLIDPDGGFKDTNPKDAVGTAKAPFSTVPAQVIAEVGLAMLEGSLKYGRHNFRSVGVRGSVYYDAALRHLTAWWEGQDFDPDSDLPHIVKAIACLAVLRDSQTQGNWVDDRPPKTPGDWVKDLNNKAAALLEKYPNPAPAYTEVGQ